MVDQLNLDWTQITVGVAAVAALVYVSRTMKRVIDSTLTFLGNHMSSVTKAQKDTAVALHDIASVLGVLSERVDRLHDDNLITADKLEHADRVTVRKVEEQSFSKSQ